MESDLSSNKLKTILRFLLDNYDQDIYTEENGLVYIYNRQERTNFMLLCTMQSLIEEAVAVAIKLGMSKETFSPVGRAMDKI